MCGLAGGISTIVIVLVGRVVLRGRGFLSLFIGVVSGGDSDLEVGVFGVWVSTCLPTYLGEELGLWVGTVG